MLTITRKTLLLDRLARDGQLAVTSLSAELGVSEETLRCDLRDLASEGKLIRVHGGAVSSSQTHRPVDERRTLYSAEKRDLARAAAAMITDGMIVVIDGGTTHMEIAPEIPRHRRCTVVTHSPAIAASFEFHDRIDIVLIGGRLFQHSMVALGPETGQAFSRVKADLCFVGVTGLHPEHGLTTGNGEEAALKRIMMAGAGESVVLATRDKIGNASPWHIAWLTRLSTLVTADDRPDWLPDAVSHVKAEKGPRLGGRGALQTP